MEQVNHMLKSMRIPLKQRSINLWLFSDNFWTAIGLKHNTKYIFRVRAKNEYGWSAYSEISEESELPNKVYKIVFMMAICLALFCIFGVITLFIFLQCKIFLKIPPFLPDFKNNSDFYIRSVST